MYDYHALFHYGTFASNFSPSKKHEIHQPSIRIIFVRRWRVLMTSSSFRQIMNVANSKQYHAMPTRNKLHSLSWETTWETTKKKSTSEREVCARATRSEIVNLLHKRKLATVESFKGSTIKHWYGVNLMWRYFNDFKLRVQTRLDTTFFFFFEIRCKDEQRCTKISLDC